MMSIFSPFSSLTTALTRLPFGFKIDIKSETQAREAGDFDYVEEEEYEEEGNYDESAAEEEIISAEEDFDENDVETAEEAGDEE
mgnify:CR=1 FL=1